MSAPEIEMLDAFVRGDVALAELEDALRRRIAVDAAAAQRLREHIDRLYADGRLPLQVHGMLARIVTDGIAGDEVVNAGTASAGGGGVADDAFGDDATRLKPPPDDATRIRPSPRTAPPPDDATRLKPSPSAAAGFNLPPPDDATRPRPPAPPPDATRVKPAASADATQAQPSTVATGAATGSDWAHPEHWQDAGAVLGPGSVVKQRFVLESVLGQGGMGVVYRALDRRKEEAQDREPYVAIKILSEEFRRHPNALIALQREARKAQTLAHPNVITVHDFDRDGTTVYMTMELLDGEPLNRVIASNGLRGLPRDKALPIVAGMAAALAYAHENGIVHSDFKPGNVFLTRRGVKVLDFGIARAVPTQLQPDGDKTVFDAAELGALTPSYASPEMIRGEAPAPADDVFALGIVAYELLTGRHPFDKVPAETARQQGVTPPVVAALPRRQRKALARALSFDRDARHPDAAAFLKDLQGPSPVRKAAYAGVLVALAGVAAYAFYSGNQLRPDVPWEQLPDETRQAFDAAVAEGQRALDIGDFALNDAFEYYSRAFTLHRNNRRAIVGLENVADRFLGAMAGADAADQRNVVRKLYCQEYLSSYDAVVSACDRTFGSGQCTRAVLGCINADGEP